MMFSSEFSPVVWSSTATPRDQIISEGEWWDGGGVSQPWNSHGEEILLCPIWTARYSKQRPAVLFHSVSWKVAGLLSVLLGNIYTNMFVILPVKTKQSKTDLKKKIENNCLLWMLEGTNRISEICTFSLSHRDRDWVIVDCDRSGCVTGLHCLQKHDLGRAKKKKNTKPYPARI